MGGGCSNLNSAKVQDSIKPTNINELTKEAQQQLKAMQGETAPRGKWDPISHPRPDC